MSFFDRLRNKSPQARKRYALGIAGCVTVFIASIWATTLPAQFGRTVEDKPSALAEALRDSKEQVANTIGSGIDQVQEAEQVRTTNLNALHGGEEEAGGVPSPATTTTEDVRVTETPTPMVILIGTTTVQKTE